MEKIAFGRMIIYKDKKYNFIEYFNPQNGFLIRGDVIGQKVTSKIIGYWNYGTMSHFSTWNM